MTIHQTFLLLFYASLLGVMKISSHLGIDICFCLAISGEAYQVKMANS